MREVTGVGRAARGAGVGFLVVLPTSVLRCFLLAEDARPQLCAELLPRSLEEAEPLLKLPRVPRTSNLFRTNVGSEGSQVVQSQETGRREDGLGFLGADVGSDSRRVERGEGEGDGSVVDGGVGKREGDIVQSWRGRLEPEDDVGGQRAK